ncbi:MAG: hypothetical protein ACTTJO_01925 [Metamycoplasmataceae bacterium]
MDNQFLLFNTYKKKIFFNFNNEIEKIKNKMEDIDNSSKIKIKINFQNQKIVNKVSITNFQIILRNKKIKLILHFELFSNKTNFFLYVSSFSKNKDIANLEILNKIKCLTL